MQLESDVHFNNIIIYYTYKTIDFIYYYKNNL